MAPAGCFRDNQHVDWHGNSSHLGSFKNIAEDSQPNANAGENIIFSTVLVPSRVPCGYLAGHIGPCNTLGTKQTESQISHAAAFYFVGGVRRYPFLFNVLQNYIPFAPGPK
jgi:hypothetical protein